MFYFIKPTVDFEDLAKRKKMSRLYPSVYFESYLGNDFLSNRYVCAINDKGTVYRSAEHFYQSERCLLQKDKDLIQSIKDPTTVVSIALSTKERPKWEMKKRRIMKRILQLKFRNRKLRRLLRETGDRNLIGVTFQHDTFWYRCGCLNHKHRGLNVLGKLLMEIREEIKQMEIGVPMF